MAISQISQANFSYISRQKALSGTNSVQTKPQSAILAPLAQDEAFLSKNSKKGNGINKVKIGCYILLAMGITAQFIADYKRNHLAKHIDFQPAKTLEEAKNFARKYLKIKEFDLTDLDCANYVNEALSTFNNASKTHEKLISSIASAEKTGSKSVHLFGIITNSTQKGDLKVYEKNILESIEEAFENISDTRDKFLKGNGIAQEIKAIYQKFLTDPNSLSFKEKMNFLVFCDSHSADTLFDKSSAIFAQCLSDENCFKYLKNNNLPTTIKGFSKLSTQEKTNILTRLVNDTSFEYKANSTGEFGIVNHEIGHLLHARNIGESYDYMAYQDKLKYDETLSRARTDDFSSAVFDNISWYSLSSSLEYVAEIYSYLKAGHKFCPEIMKKYFALGGVLP